VQLGIDERFADDLGFAYTLQGGPIRISGDE
jgi:hypothetical protein